MRLAGTVTVLLPTCLKIVGKFWTHQRLGSYCCWFNCTVTFCLLLSFLLSGYPPIVKQVKLIIVGDYVPVISSSLMVPFLPWAFRVLSIRAHLVVPPWPWSFRVLSLRDHHRGNVTLLASIVNNNAFSLNKQSSLAHPSPISLGKEIQWK